MSLKQLHSLWRLTFSLKTSFHYRAHVGPFHFNPFVWNWEKYKCGIEKNNMYWLYTCIKIFDAFSIFRGYVHFIDQNFNKNFNFFFGSDTKLFWNIFETYLPQKSHYSMVDHLLNHWCCQIKSYMYHYQLYFENHKFVMIFLCYLSSTL